MRQFRYDYYVVSVPRDCADTIEELAQIAVSQAEENTRLYCIPCIWEAKLICGDLESTNVVFQVRRKRNNVH